MDMYPSGKIKLLQVKNKDIDLQIFGDDLNKLSKNRKINQNTPAFISLSPSKEDFKIYTLTDKDGLARNQGNSMLPVFFENGQYDLIVKTREEKDLSFLQNGVSIDQYFQKISNISLGSINFRADVGYTNLDIYQGSRKILSLIVEVFPSKMDYRKDYEKMVSEINEEIASIAFTILDKTYLESELKDSKNQTKTEFINILDCIFDDFIKSLNYIVKNFKHNIVEKEKLVPIDKAKKASMKTRDYLRTRPYLLREDRDGFININTKSYLPEKIIEVKKLTSIDIFENQLVKYMIKDIVRRIESLEKILIKTNGRTYRDLIDSKYKLREKKNKLKAYLKQYFTNISDIAPRHTMSLVFKMSPGYKDAYKKYKILSKGLDLGDDLFKISPKKIYELYEMWSYIKLHKMLYDLGYNVKEYGIIDYKDNGLYLRLNTDKEASMIYENNNQSLRLWYNKNYSVPTTRQRPDTVLYIQNLNSRQKRTYLFDAKYRMKIDEDGRESPLEEDINVMHRYRDAIVSEIDDGIKYKYNTFGAYVMFPCSDEREFENHRFYKTIDKVNIGAFPMLPGSTSLIKNHLRKILKASDLEAKESRLVIDEFENYSRFKKEDVMVVNVIDQEHLKAYLKYSFYQISKSVLSNLRLGVEYIAFYQPKTSFKDKAGIYYYGKISKSYDYVSKYKQINSSLGNNKKYLRFDLEEIKRISPVKPYEIGTMTLSYTSLYLLHNAENMRELKMKSSLEMKVYKLLLDLSKREGLQLKKIDNSEKNIELYKFGNREIKIIDGKYIRWDGRFIEYRDLKKLLIKTI